MPFQVAYKLNIPLLNSLQSSAKVAFLAAEAAKTDVLEVSHSGESKALELIYAANLAWQKLYNEALTASTYASVDELHTWGMYLKSLRDEATARIAQLENWKTQVTISKPSQRNPAHPCLPGSAYDKASGWCVPIAGWPESQLTPPPPSPIPGLLGKLGLESTPLGLTPDQASTISFYLPPVAGTIIGYLVRRSVLGAALGAAGGYLASLLLQKGPLT